MAIIGKIRERSWLILIVIGGALVTFIFTSQGPGGAEGDEEQYGIGTVYGEKVDIDEFNDRVDEEQEASDTQKQNQENQQAQQQQRQAQRIPSVPVDRARVWNTHVQELILEKEYEALGVTVSPEEFDAYLFGEQGFEVLPDISSTFVDSARVFDPNLLRARIDEMESGEPDVQDQWEKSKTYYTEQRQKQKYLDIVGQGVYVTKLEAKDEYFAKEETKSVSFVVRRYAEIDNEDVNPTYKQLKAFYKKHKSEKKYENKFSSRDIRYATLKVESSGADSTSLRDELTALKESFSNTNNDSSFVMINSEIPLFVSQIGYKPQGDKTAKENFTYPANLDTVFKAAQIGDIVGPYWDNGTMKIAKVLAKKDKFLTARHILISAQKGDTVGIAKAQVTTDSLMELITSENFEEYVTNFTADPGSKETGGKYEDFLDGEMVPEFSKYAMEEPIGKIGYVQTDFGFHIMEVLDRKPANIPNLGVIQKSIKPSDVTADNIENNAYSLLENIFRKTEGTRNINKKIAFFDTLVKNAGSAAFPMSLQDNRPQMNQFTSPFAESEIYKLAFSEKAKAGDILGSPIKDGDRWVVAILTSIKVKGESKFGDVKAIVKGEYILDAKYRRLSSKMKGKSLETLSKDAGNSILTEEVLFGFTKMGNSIPDEPNVIGAIFGALKDGKMTKPLKGKQGVYVVRLERTIKPIVADKNYLTERDQITAKVRLGLKAVVTAALVDQADVIDNRKLRENGIRR
jgi:peptidyl-prolyl cis-trans isomerase D